LFSRHSIAHYCSSSAEKIAAANDPGLIATGFNITNIYVSCQEAYSKIVAGEIAYTTHERQ